MFICCQPFPKVSWADHRTSKYFWGFILQITNKKNNEMRKNVKFSSPFRNEELSRWFWDDDCYPFVLLNSPIWDKIVRWQFHPLHFVPLTNIAFFILVIVRKVSPLGINFNGDEPSWSFDRYIYDVSNGLGATIIVFFLHTWSTGSNRYESWLKNDCDIWFHTSRRK